MQKKKPSLSPDAAKILEQYRNAGKKGSVNPDATGTAEDENGVPRPSTPPPAQQMRRSGTRGK